MDHVLCGLTDLSDISALPLTGCAVWVRGTGANPWPCCLWHLCVHSLHLPKPMYLDSWPAEACSPYISLPGTCPPEPPPLCASLVPAVPQDWLSFSAALWKEVLMCSLHGSEFFQWKSNNLFCFLDIPEWGNGMMHREQTFDYWTGCLWTGRLRDLPQTCFWHRASCIHSSMPRFVNVHLSFSKPKWRISWKFSLSCVRMNTPHLFDWGHLLLPLSSFEHHDRFNISATFLLLHHSQHKTL